MGTSPATERDTLLHEPCDCETAVTALTKSAEAGGLGLLDPSSQVWYAHPLIALPHDHEKDCGLAKLPSFWAR